MKLYIDSTNNLKTTVRIGDQELTKNYELPRDQNILGAIQELLEKNQTPMSDITSIEVNHGPGSFTGVRLGIAIANALAFALKIKVNGKNPPLEPNYGREPNITKKK
jgi:tRNA threonylcarbamoyladenosine biosynthesis protein TsaB